ncbi:unnamed protein product [Gongylonema pulchrum]|uniref:Uncharacterized protein n=1 Tax=Gongylonema pulchrum TaxID=637853 RepID=A0A183EZ53_9BILA|nr:unnamed protein product [Gongylonema pulchrum]
MLQILWGEQENAEHPKRSSTRQAPNTDGGISHVVQQLEQMIVSDEWTNKEAKDHTGIQLLESARKKSTSVTPRLSELGRTLVTSSSLKAYIDLLGTHHRQCIAAWLYGSASQTISTLFRTSNNNLYCSDYDSNYSNSIKAGIGSFLIFKIIYVSSFEIFLIHYK